MEPRTTSNTPRSSNVSRGALVTTLERRIRELEQLTESQNRELRIQFERIAQLQAEWDILRHRCVKS